MLFFIRPRHPVRSQTAMPEQIHTKFLGCYFNYPFNDGSEIREAGAFQQALLASCAAGQPMDPAPIVTTMEVWLDHAVFDSQTLPLPEDFHTKVLEISQLYLTWKAKHDAAIEAKYQTLVICEEVRLENNPVEKSLTLLRLCRLLQTKRPKANPEDGL